MASKVFKWNPSRVFTWSVVSNLMFKFCWSSKSNDDKIIENSLSCGIMCTILITFQHQEFRTKVNLIVNSII